MGLTQTVVVIGSAFVAISIGVLVLSNEKMPMWERVLRALGALIVFGGASYWAANYWR